MGAFLNLDMNDPMLVRETTEMVCGLDVSLEKKIVERFRNTDDWAKMNAYPAGAVAALDLAVPPARVAMRASGWATSGQTGS